MRDEREARASEGAIFLERAERLATDDPYAALPLFLEALLACRRSKVLCLETRTFAALGTTFALMGRLGSAETSFRAARRSKCPCCRTVVERQFAYFLDCQGRQAEALIWATRAVEASEGAEKGRALDTLGIIRYHAGDFSGALEAYAEALDLIPVRSDCHDRTRANLATALNESDKLEDVQRAVNILRALPARFRGTKYLTVERAMAAWTLGATLAKLVRLSPGLKAWERRGILLEARDSLRAASSGLEKRGLILELAAIRSDLAAVQAMSDPFKVLEALEDVPVRGEQNGKAFDLSEAKAAAIDAAAGVFSLDRMQLIWETLGALREATVAAGAAPPVMVYAP
jgi:tetratricopeptide (TPR) repeat protein